MRANVTTGRRCYSKAVSALPYILPGETVSDAVAVLGSLDPIMGEVDR